MDKKIETMRAAGAILGEVLEKLLDYARPGVSELEIDALAEKLIRERNAEPGFKKVPSYKHSICVSTNNVVVHGIPTKYILKEGDIFGIDCGVYLNGYHTDMAETIIVKSSKFKVKSSVEEFLKVGKKALFAGIREAKAGNRVGHISQAIQRTVEGPGYSIVRNLVGHGVGKNLHEEPEIPGYLSAKIEQTKLLFPGQTLAIEAIYNMGESEVAHDRNDDWTIVTRDGSLSGLFERTILVTEKSPEILSRLSGDESFEV
jgi:methionyl aminopeptidase